MKITQRLISLVLTIVMISSFACLAVSAKTVYPVGNWVYEYINNDTEFEIDTYNGNVATLTTPQSHNSTPITSIGSNAFSSNTKLTKITFSTPVKYVQRYAFVNASNLATVVCSSNLELIDSYAFSGCSSLSSINLEDTAITAVNNSSFINCDSLTEVTLPDTVTTIETKAFAYCNSLSKVVIPNQVTTIADDAFYDSNNVVIYCYRDSAAHTYAEANSIEYVLFEDFSYILGDADNDGKVTVLDATYIQFVLVGFVDDTDGKISIRGDINFDILSILDATAIQLHLAMININENIGNTYYYE